MPVVLLQFSKQCDFHQISLNFRHNNNIYPEVINTQRKTVVVVNVVVDVVVIFVADKC